MSSWSFLEFFAGGGFARLGLGDNWKCLLANDWDPKKAATYKENWGNSDLHCEDVANLQTNLISEKTDLAWASFPCQDVSLAGAGAGLLGDRSGTFWPFWKFVTALASEDRAPSIVVIENVCGMITSKRGKDFDAICNALVQEGYRVGAIVVDAALFVPQSRKRVFIIGVKDHIKIPSHLISPTPKYFQSDSIQRAVAERLTIDPQKWINWNPSPPDVKVENLQSILDTNTTVAWDSPEQTCHLLKLMSPTTLLKLRHVRKSEKSTVGTVYRRMRKNKSGQKVQRAEVRFDGIAGCLRAPTGGSSKQTLIFVEGNNIRTRRLSGQEAVRLMGVPDSYKISKRQNDAYKLAGEGVAVPVVRYLSQSIFEPILDAN